MSRTVERIVSVGLALILIVTFFIVGRSGANETIDNAQATSAALQNTVDELLSAPKFPDLSGELMDAHGALDAANTEVANLLATMNAVEPPSTTLPETPTATALPSTPTATATPEVCYPDNLDEVVAIRNPRVNLFEEIGQNAKGKMIMGIYEDDDGNRIQYTVGDTFFVYEDAITTDGSDTVYEVFGPRGNGLYVRAVHIKLFNPLPDLYICGS